MELPETGKSADSRRHSVREHSDRRWVEEQRELVQEALLEGEERLQALLDDCMAAVYLKDLEGRYLKANRWAEIMFRRDLEEVSGKTDHDLFPKEVADALRANDLEALKAEAPLRFEQRFLHEDGEYTYEATKFPLHDSAGDPYAVCGIAIDVTERKRAVDKAEESEDRFRALVQNSSDVVTVLDAGGAILYVSPAIESVLGYRPEERIGGNAFDHVHPDDAERVKGLYAQAANDTEGIGGPQQFRMRHADGSWRYVETIRNNLLDDPSVRGIVVNLRDVTERQEAEEERRKSEEKYRGIFENAVEGIYQTTHGGRLISANPAAARILGYASPEETLTDVEQLYVDPKRRDQFVDLMRENERVVEFESRIHREDGSIAWISESARAVRDAEGTLLYYEGFVMDITERKEAEEALKESEERFRSLVHNASDVITILDADGVIQYESPSIERILGYHPEELVGEYAWDFVHPDDQELVSRGFSRTAETPGENLDPVQFRFRHKDGSWRYLEAVGNNLLDRSSVGGIVANSRDVSERKEAEEALKESEERYRAVIEQSTDGIYLFDGGTKRILETNASLREMFGYTAEEFRGMALYDLIAHDRDNVDSAVRRTMQEGRRLIGEREYVRKDGTLLDVEVGVNPISYGGKDVICAIVRDVTERKRAEEALTESEERYRAVMEQSADGIWLFDPETMRVLEFNESFRALLGYAAEELDGLSVYDFIAHDPEDVDAVTERNLQLRQSFVGERKYRRKDGSLIDVDVSACVIPYQGKELVCGVARDVSERKALEEQLMHQAFYDPLTELPNRVLLLDRVRHALAQTNRLQAPIAVLFVDLDDFKVVNDSLGHDAGNALLVGVAERLRACVRPGDTVARLFGDEFAILLEAPADLDDARRVTERIGERLRESFVLDGQEAFMSASIGIALSDSAGNLPEDVLRRADLAMYTAKRRRKAEYEVFQPSMDTQAVERLDLENQLRRAIEREEFEVYYQPMVDLGSGEITGLEALARWRHPRRGLVSPGEFIEFAEETGLIRPIGRWVLEESCRQAMEWRERYKPLLMSVNLSTSQFSHQPDLISEVLKDTGMDPENLQLEITERVVMDDAEFSLGKLQKLRGLGVRFAIDDYGTGYSCLYYLKRMPVSLLKIDRAFIVGLGNDRGDEAIVAGTVSLAHALGLKVVAEGVETADQLAKLAELGCDMVQGFFFAKPLPAGAIPSLLVDGLQPK